MKSQNLPGKLIACLGHGREGERSERRGKRAETGAWQWASALHKKWSVLAQDSQPLSGPAP